MSKITFWSAIGHGLVVFLIFFWGLLAEWLKLLFVAPFKDFAILWIIIPIWVAWFFAEFFQEKHSTSFGNAISNGAIALWVGVDWIRYVVNSLSSGSMKFGWGVVGKFFISLLVLGYGLLIIIEGIKSQSFIHFIGRIREVTYVLLVFSPIVYGIIRPNWRMWLAIVVFAPLFYYAIELIDQMTPTPKIFEEDEGSGSQPASNNLGF